MGKRKTPLPLSAFVQGFVLSVKTEGKAPSTVDFLEGNLRRFLWYARQQGWPDDAQALDAWKIREFLGYCATACNRWRRRPTRPGASASSRRAYASP